MSGASLFHEAAQPRRLREDFDSAPTQERMGPQRVPRRNPSTDQKKARTQMARQSTQESTMAQQHTEAEYLQRIASAPTLVEQQRLSAELAAFRQQRAAELRSEAAYGSIREASARVAAAAPPAFAKHSIASDWLAEAAETGTDTRQVEAQMRAEASVWYEGRPAAVKASAEEIRAQAHGIASRVASQHGLAAAGARAAFLAQVEHLSKVAMDEVQQPPYGVPSGSSLPDAGGNKDTFDDSLLTAPGGADPKTESGDSASLKEGDSPEGDTSQGIENPAVDTTHDSNSGVKEYVDPNPSGGKSASWDPAPEGWQASPRTPVSPEQQARDSEYAKIWGQYLSDAQSMSHADAKAKYDKAVAELNAKTSRRKTASINLTNVGIVDKAGLVCKGKDSSGNEVRFKVTQSEMDQLASVLYGDLALNFSGVTIEESDVIRSEGSRKVADDQTSTEADGAVPSLSEGDAPEGDHAEPTVLPAVGTGHDAGPGNDAAVDSIDGTTYPKQASLRAIAASITTTEASAPFVSALATLESVEGSVAGISGRDIVGYVLRSASLNPGQKAALEAHLAGVVPPFRADAAAKTAVEGLPEHLQSYWGNRTDDPRENPMFCAKQSHKTPAIPWHNGLDKCLACGTDVKALRQKTSAAHKTAGKVCSVCGDAIAHDGDSWHHDNGEKHDHEAKPKDESSDTTPSPDSDAGGGGGYRAAGSLTLDPTFASRVQASLKTALPSYIDQLEPGEQYEEGYTEGETAEKVAPPYADGLEDGAEGRPRSKYHNYH